MAWCIMKKSGNSLTIKRFCIYVTVFKNKYFQLPGWVTNQFISLFLFLCCLALSGCKRMPAGDLNTITPEQYIKPVATIFREEQPLLSAREALKMKFEPYDNRLIDSDHKVYWLKFSIKNPENKEITMYTSGFFSDKLEVYRYNQYADSVFDQGSNSGYLVPPEERTVRYSQNTIVPIYVPPSSADIYLIRVHNYTSRGRESAFTTFRMAFILYTAPRFELRYNFLSHYNSFLFGLMIITALYNSLTFLWGREKVFGYLALYNLANCSWVFLLGGMLVSWGLIDNLGLECTLRQTIPAPFILISYTLFSTSFLRLRKHSRLMFSLIWSLIILFVVIGAYYFVDYKVTYQVTILIVVAIYALIPVSGIIVYRKGQSNAIYMVAGSSLFFLSVTTYLYFQISEKFNYLDGHVILQTCMLVEMIIFTVATTRQIGDLKKERNRVQEEKSALAKKLEEKSRKLIAYTTERIRQNEALEQIRKEVAFENGNSALLKKRIQSLKDPGTNWETFKLYFENIHPDFFRILSEQYPDLNANEERLCAFIKMGMTTKEIASLQGVTTRAVDKARERLKKKMKLDQDTSVSEAVRAINILNVQRQRGKD